MLGKQKRTQDGDDQVIRFPTQAIETVLSDLVFPATKAQVLARAGQGLIKVGSDEEVRLSEIISASPINEFTSLVAVVEEVGRLLENPNHIALPERK